jgi:hypothetical protein
MVEINQIYTDLVNKKLHLPDEKMPLYADAWTRIYKNTYLSNPDDPFYTNMNSYEKAAAA